MNNELRIIFRQGTGLAYYAGEHGVAAWSAAS